MNRFRERDIRRAVCNLLEQSGAFDGVYLSGLPEDRGQPAADSQAVSIEPERTQGVDAADDHNGNLLMTCRLNLILLARHEDPQQRDECAERLVNVVAALLSGQSLGEATIPSTTRIVEWVWQRPVPPERRICAALEFQYLVDGWSGFNIDE